MRFTGFRGRSVRVARRPSEPVGTPSRRTGSSPVEASFLNSPMTNENAKNWTVYALQSLIRNYIYVGMASDLEKRIKQHNDGHERTTKPYAPFRSIFTETFPNRPLARIKEKWLKTSTGKRFLRSSE